jgi:hypothetical protein
MCFLYSQFTTLNFWCFINQYSIFQSQFEEGVAMGLNATVSNIFLGKDNLYFYNFNYCINTKPMKYSLRFLVSRCRVLYVTSIIFTKHVDLKLSALSYILTVSSIDEVNWRKPKKCCKTRRPYMGRCSYIDCRRVLLWGLTPLSAIYF